VLARLHQWIAVMLSPSSKAIGLEVLRLILDWRASPLPETFIGHFRPPPHFSTFKLQYEFIR